MLGTSKRAREPAPGFGGGGKVELRDEALKRRKRRKEAVEGSGGERRRVEERDERGKAFRTQLWDGLEWWKGGRRE